LCIGVGLLAVAAYSDVQTRRIPNALAATVAAVGLARMAINGDFPAVFFTLGASVTIFFATFLLFWRGLLGGGDVKLIAATALLVGYGDLFAFLFEMSVCGALVALAVFARHELAARRATVPALQGPRERPARLTVPYGVPIAAAGIFTLIVQSFVPG
jgi:prepilin peptidase CpaA